MPLAQIYFDKEEDKKLDKFSHRWNISKHEVVKRIVRDFKDVKKEVER